MRISFLIFATISWHGVRSDETLLMATTKESAKGKSASESFSGYFWESGCQWLGIGCTPPPSPKTVPFQQSPLKSKPQPDPLISESRVVGVGCDWFGMWCDTATEEIARSVTDAETFHPEPPQEASPANEPLNTGLTQSVMNTAGSGGRLIMKMTTELPELLRLIAIDYAEEIKDEATCEEIQGDKPKWLKRLEAVAESTMNFVGRRSTGLYKMMVANLWKELCGFFSSTFSHLYGTFYHSRMDFSNNLYSYLSQNMALKSAENAENIPPTPDEVEAADQSQPFIFANATVSWESVGIDEISSCMGKDITDEERQAVKDLRSRIQSMTSLERQSFGSWFGSGELDDREILRFVRANHLDLATAWASLSRAAAWRQQFGLNAATLDLSVLPSSEVIQQEIFWLGQTKDGCQTLVIRSAMHFPGQASTEDYSRYFGQILEIGRRKWGVGIRTPVCALVDRHLATKQNYDRLLMTELFPSFQEYYPEIIGTIYIAPVNFFFWVIWAAVSSFINESYREKVNIISGEDFKSELLQYFDSDVLPEHLGGKKVHY